MSCVGVRGVEAFMVLYENEDVVFAGFGEEGFMVCEVFDGGLGDEDVYASPDGVERNGIVRRVRGEYRHRIARGKGLDGGHVGVWIVGSGV